MSCDHRGDHEHACESVWMPDAQRLGLRVRVKCLACGEQLKFDPKSPIMRVRVVDEGTKLLVLFQK